MPEVSREDVISYLENANLLEISELVKDIEEKFPHGNLMQQKWNSQINLRVKIWVCLR